MMDYSFLPKVDLVANAAEKKLIENIEPISVAVLTESVHSAIDTLRKNISLLECATKQDCFKAAVSDALTEYKKRMTPSLRRVINATGVVLHTNLGRAPLAVPACEAVYETARNYSNLEMNLETGKRGNRYEHVSKLLCDLTGAEDAIIVNNNAAAVLITIDTIAKGGEAIVSRGQLVEIGGSFRIPDVIQSCGAMLREVGATNKTHLYDYERVIGENTACLLQVHPSNFYIDGFFEEVPTSDLSKLAHEHNLPLVYDLGSGCIHPFAATGIGREPLPYQVIKYGADILTFSGDKLLGGPQAGIIVGEKKYLDKIKKNPLMRALRVDKLTLAALMATLEMYRDNRAHEIPAIAMISESSEQLKAKAEDFANMLKEANANITVKTSKSPIGGGSMPDVRLDSWIVAIVPNACSAEEFAARLRQKTPSVLGYINENQLCFDLRTVDVADLEITAHLIKEAVL